MNVVVSAIVDPWVTTLSFVVALAMRIQGSDMYIKRFMATFGSHLSHIQDVFKSYCHVIAMTFVEIQKIFEQLFVTLSGKFKSA